MDKLTDCAALILVGLVVGFSAGCGMKSTAPPVVVDGAKLPGADAVTAALEKKDYDGAIAAWMKLKESIATEDQHSQFILLTRQISTKLSEAAPNDPKAAEAAGALRQMTLGR
jgi:hypothetical protein